MRTLLATLLSIALICLPSACVGQPAFQYLDDSIMTNLVIKQAFGGTWSNLLRGGEIRISRSQRPTLDFIQSGTGQGAWPPGQGALSFDTLAGFGMNADLSVVGDVTVSGTVNSSGTILWQTNLVWSTNAFYAPTNSQTTTVDMSIGYADIRIDGATTPLTFTAGTLLADSYQTACIFVKNYPATNTVRLSVENVPYIRGVPYVTNVSVLTVFTHNWTNDVWTNAVVLPLW